MADTVLIAAAAQRLYEARGGANLGRHPRGPRHVWAALGLAMGRDLAWLASTASTPRQASMDRERALALLEDCEADVDAAMRLQGRGGADIVWPWDRDPHWEKPREGATSDPADTANWMARCRWCGRLDVMTADHNGHAVAAHPVEHAASQHRAHIDLVWVGLGAPPTAPGLNRTPDARRPV